MENIERYQQLEFLRDQIKRELRHINDDTGGHSRNVVSLILKTISKNYGRKKRRDIIKQLKIRELIPDLGEEL